MSYAQWRNSRTFLYCCSTQVQITHGGLFSQPDSLLAIILQLPNAKTRLTSIPTSYPGMLESRNATFQFMLLNTFYNHFARTLQKTIAVVKMC
jgi:hypothetical protein